MTAFPGCPNDPPCPHGGVLHGIWTLDDPRPMRCAGGCDFGQPGKTVTGAREPRCGNRAAPTPGRNPAGGCWAHGSDVYREPAYRWWLEGGSIIDLCAGCTAQWRMMAASGTSWPAGPPLRVRELPRVPTAAEAEADGLRVFRPAVDRLHDLYRT